MPAKVSLFNMKAEPIFDFGTGPRNLAYFNPHGNNILYVSRKFSACLYTFIFYLGRLNTNFQPLFTLILVTFVFGWFWESAWKLGILGYEDQEVNSTNSVTRHNQF